MGNILLEALMNILFNYHFIYNNYTFEFFLFGSVGVNNAGRTFYMMLINEALLINKHVFK